MKDKLPIWMTDWTMMHPKTKVKYVVKDVLAKGWDVDSIINNEMLIKKVLKKLGKQKNKVTLIPTNVELKSQHGFGPPYENVTIS